MLLFVWSRHTQRTVGITTLALAGKPQPQAKEFVLSIRTANLSFFFGLPFCRGSGAFATFFTISSKAEFVFGAAEVAGGCDEFAALRTNPLLPLPKFSRLGIYGFLPNILDERRAGSC